MRELSDREQAFLRGSLPEGAETVGTGSSSESHSSGPASRKGRPRRASSRLTQTLGSVLRYLPLAIGTVTLLIAAFATYLYIWGRSFFKVSEIERLNEDGTLGLMDSTSGSWVRETLKVFELAPLAILGTVILGLLLMGLSMILVRKRENG